MSESRRAPLPPYWFMVGSAAVAGSSWLLLVVLGQFQVSWLAPYEDLLDAAFLIGLVGVALGDSWARFGGRVRAVTLRVALVVGALATAAVASEFAARFAFRDVHSSADGRSYFARRGLPIRVNRLGFRDREVGPKSAGRYRIVVVGDSFTWGQGIREDDRFSNLLERQLGPRHEVFNFGIPGNNMPEHVQVLQRALSVSPDFVLLQLFINDFETATMERPRPWPLLPWPSLDRRLLYSSAVYAIFSDEWSRVQEASGMVESYPRYMRRHLEDPGSPDSREAFSGLRAFIERARAAGVPSGTVLFPNPSYPGRVYPFEYLHHRVRATCLAEHIRCVDLRPVFDHVRDPRVLWVNRFDAHPSALANQRAATAILNEFGGLWGQ